MFNPVSPKLDAQKLEHDVLNFWKRENIFQKSMDNRKGGARYVFYEGPPTANGKPGSHHVLARVFKDMFPRYHVMRGKHILRRGGWDTHGLPVEIEVEKQLGFSGKDQVEKYGIAEFNAKCRKSAFDYIQDWERMTERIGFWVDLKTAYVTYTNEYIESVWWILKQFWDRDLIYQGFKVVPYCARCGTPLSDHEVSLGYQDDTEDPSVFVRFPLKDEPGTSFLVWTTTPWTLPGNVALAVGPEVLYLKVERKIGENGGTEKLIIAKDLADKVLGEGTYKVVGDYKGKELKGKRYSPLYSFMPFEGKAHYVVLGDFVTTSDGTGVVHQAPAFGADDLKMANENDLPVLMTVDERGQFVDAVKPWRHMWVKDADPLIMRDLDDRGLLFRAETYLHTYPFCWRCGTPLLYYARSTWYIETTKFKEQLVGLNNTINWVPDHIRTGRFGNWLENNIDWALGRERYWGTALPVWVDEDGNMVCVGSVEELSKLAGRDLSDLDLHRPYVDEVTFPNPKTGKTMKRVPELIDVWFDSGAMPVAQWHYPFENKEMFEEQFPADYICEAIDQTRGWFYSLHAISTLLFNSVSFKNVICLGHILDGEGQKMSKSKGNIVDPWNVLNANGADAFRWYLYTASPPGNSRRFSVDLVGEAVRNFMLPLWNTYSFFVTYANLANWKPGADLPSSALTPLDKWILSELHTLVRVVTDAYENYDVTNATRPIEKFLDYLSNWWLRRSRRRFWKSEGEMTDADRAAYSTLHECLVTVAKLLAPAMPFMSDAIYRNLAASADSHAPESVHLADWPEAHLWRIDEKLQDEMRVVMKVASVGHAARAKANRKVRQPLAEAAFSAPLVSETAAIKAYADLLADELNVKAVRVLDHAEDAVTYSLNPLPKQLGQKHGAKFPKIKAALLAGDQTVYARALLNNEPVLVNVEGESISVLPGEVEVRQNARGGYAVADDGGYLAALKTDLTPELEREGLAREFVRRVQDLRKSAGLDISDRIVVRYTASKKLAEAIHAYTDYITSETLCVDLADGSLPDAATAEDSFDGETLKVMLARK
ncbi:MAG TPA: isoleucine--tRNA ligase [Anaerolineales bacterium]|nr:isoleucine--tRNA ligase [Anaerolineales bacterium]